MPHVVQKRGLLQGTALAVFLALVHLINDAVTAILGALLPTLQARFDASPMLLAAIVATYSIASSFSQPLFGAIAEERGLRHVGALGVVAAAVFLSLIGVAPALAAVFALLVIGGMGSGALHPVGSAIVGSPGASNRTLGVGLFSAGGMIGFAIGPILLFALIARHGVTVTPWLMLPGIALGIAVFVLLPDWELHRRRAARTLFDLSLLRGPVGRLAAA
ncbi:MAG TPA: MFS transporter, partial [Pseudomonadales bacterium]|nr:MFS transporter [Pseudomonadales bacterium]